MGLHMTQAKEILKIQKRGRLLENVYHVSKPSTQHSLTIVIAAKAWFPYDRHNRRPTARHRRRVPNQFVTYGNHHCYDYVETRL